MCGGELHQTAQPKKQEEERTHQPMQSQHQQRPSPSQAFNTRAAGGHPVRTPTSTLEHCLRTQGVEEAWRLLEVLLRDDHGDASPTTNGPGLVAADKYTMSQMLAKTDERNMPQAIILTNAFIKSWPSDVDEGLFNALLDACCQLKDVLQLEAAMDHMRRLKVEASAVTLGILVKAYGRSGQLEKAMDVWDKMVPQRKQANAVTYGCMLDSCVKCGDLKRALHVFEDVKKEGKHRNTVLYTTLIKGCSKQKDLQSALTLFRDMKQEAVPYNIITYNSIIDVCVNCGAVHVAEGIFQQMINEEGQSNGSSPDLITFSTLLKGYCHAGELDKAFMVLEAIRERGLPCDELVYNTLINGCVKTCDLTTGLGLFQEMLASGATPSAITHSILVKLYRIAGYGQHSAEAVAVLYQHHGLSPPVVGVRRRRETGRRESFPCHSSGCRERQNCSVRNETQRSNSSAAASPPCSSPGSMPSMQHPGSCWDQVRSTEAVFGSMDCYTAAVSPAELSSPIPELSTPIHNMPVSSAELSSPIQNMPVHQSGSWMIMGPYPAPLNGLPAAAPESARYTPKTKAIIKI